MSQLLGFYFFILITYSGCSSMSYIIKAIFLTGLNVHYAHGNEPSHHIAHLFNNVEMTWRTQKIFTHFMNDSGLLSMMENEKIFYN